FGSTPQTGVGGVDYTGLVNQKYQADLQASQAKMGGLFGLASAGIGLFSDRRLKHDIKRIGTLFNGMSVYSFKYHGDQTTHMGLMADEVLDVVPDAVHLDPSGFYRV